MRICCRFCTFKDAKDRRVVASERIRKNLRVRDAENIQRKKEEAAFEESKHNKAPMLTVRLLNKTQQQSAPNAGWKI